MFSVRPLTVVLADVCFCHWPVDADALSRSIPDWLTVETADGDAWVTAVAHTISGVSSFGVDLTGPVAAVTVRTYVRGPDGHRGVRFLAVYADDALTATVTEPALRLPYREGRLGRQTDDGEYRTRRTLDVDGRRVLDVRYTPGDGETTTAPPDSLAAFLVERHRYFTTGGFGTHLVGSVGHDPWPLGTVDADVSGTLLPTLGLPDPAGSPLVHYSPGTELGLSPPRPLWLD
ncbi:DUF2071 domain-containing protein [Halomicroarcula sp. S1AR25-4]|uniref:DUF2071 domain-containing protein n=1 Tax=Haloarcula sp. S1AR25-4 TaxID=2950538 RepID=UPI0028752303|nr:DUF2071 domain-containing protein [Halomicroarcula sp. S1AR25-4]MDS0276872.1 DUF2071 domain-containing protein [Halomicroarcula sp. S1AR25-4]